MRRLLIGAVIALAALLGTGCAGAAEPIPTATDPVPAATVAETVEVASTATGAASPTASEAPTTEAPAAENTDEGTTAASEPLPGRPNAPAGEAEDFRSDPANVVAATGNPQLLEFFTFW
jgi:hypothetical protein